MSRRVVRRGEVKAATAGAGAKRESERATSRVATDPKPGDLPMGRVKRAEHARGGPNPCRLQTAGMTCG